MQQFVADSIQLVHDYLTKELLEVFGDFKIEGQEFALCSVQTNSATGQERHSATGND